MTNPQKTADLAIFTEEVLNGKLFFLRRHIFCWPVNMLRKAKYKMYYYLLLLLFFMVEKGGDEGCNYLSVSEYGIFI